jgi:hypothetical protein
MNPMSSIDEQILRATKEIVVKFIEAGRVSPSGFHEAFKNIFDTVERTTRDSIKRTRDAARTEPVAEEPPPGKGKSKRK